MEIEAAEWEAKGASDCPAESFESGVSAALRWALGDSNDKPIENPVEQ